MFNKFHIKLILQLQLVVFEIWSLVFDVFSTLWSFVWTIINFNLFNGLGILWNIILNMRHIRLLFEEIVIPVLVTTDRHFFDIVNHFLFHSLDFMRMMGLFIPNYFGVLIIIISWCMISLRGFSFGGTFGQDVISSGFFGCLLRSHIGDFSSCFLLVFEISLEVVGNTTSWWH